MIQVFGDVEIVWKYKEIMRELNFFIHVFLRAGEGD